MNLIQRKTEINYTYFMLLTTLQNSPEYQECFTWNKTTKAQLD